MSNKQTQICGNGRPCELCKQDVQTWHCPSCSSDYCDRCWTTQVAHRHEKTSAPNHGHEKTNWNLLETMKAILEPSNDENVLKTLHANDQNTKWFGVVRDGDGKSQFDNTGRFADVMADSRPLSGSIRYPKLVAFIGDTCENACHQAELS